VHVKLLAQLPYEGGGWRFAMPDQTTGKSPRWPPVSMSHEQYPTIRVPNYRTYAHGHLWRAKVNKEIAHPRGYAAHQSIEKWKVAGAWHC
jgi:hypothetical protein